MGLNETASAERVHISFFGMRNRGKSSLVNAVTGQELAVVSEIKGTTTDPVKKAMELLPIGSVVITDTPGLDDEGELGALRVKKARQTLERTDIAVLVCDAAEGLADEDRLLLDELKKRGIPTVIAYNKSDIAERKVIAEENIPSVFVSAITGEGVKELKELLGNLAVTPEKPRYPVSDLIDGGDTVVLVVPIDEAAPKGRLILPQQLVLRDILDKHAKAMVCRPEELSSVLDVLHGVRLVITDSQVFSEVDAVVNGRVPLTSFSILMARYKGELSELVRGAAALSGLKDGSRVLIAEGCTHHRQCNDIGTVKIPGWIEKFTGVKPEYTFVSGTEYPEELSEFDLVVHCGGCMLNETEMKNRIKKAVRAGVPIVNYGVLIAHLHGILKKSIAVFDDVCDIL